MFIKPYLHVHRELLPAKEIATLCQGVRIDWEVGMTLKEIGAVVVHYQIAQLKVLLLVHDLDTAMQAAKAWPLMDIQFLCEPNLREMDRCPPEQYKALVDYMSLRHVTICGPSLNSMRGDTGQQSLRTLGVWTRMKKTIVHGYGYEPEELPSLIADIYKVSSKSREIIIGEYTNGADPMWDDEKRADYHARAVLACPVPIVLYRGPHMIPDPQGRPGFPGYFENNDGKENYRTDWRPRPAWQMLKDRLLGVAADVA